MSIILDALKKSENERRRRDRPGITDLPAATPQWRTPAWMLLTMGALVALVVVLSVAYWRLQLSPGMAPSASTDIPVSPAAASAGHEADTAHAHVQDYAEDHPVAEMPREQDVRPLGGEVVPVQAKARAHPAGDAASAPPAPAPVSGKTGFADLPSLDELTARGELTLPDLHMDLHVYATDPAQRFVFINGRRLRQGDALSPDLKVLEILADGVVLQQGSTRFVLPRD